MKLSDNLATIFKLPLLKHVAVTKDFVAEADGQGAIFHGEKVCTPFLLGKWRLANGKDRLR